MRPESTILNGKANRVSHFFHLFTAIVLLLLSAAAFGQNAVVRVNQLGYVNSASKRAYLMSKGLETGATFSLNSGGGSVFSAPIGADLGAWGTYLHVYALDFDSFSAPGTYSIAVTGPTAATSPSFKIDTGTNIYGKALANTLSYYQNNRDGADFISSVFRTAAAHLNDQHAGVYHTPTFDSNDNITSGPTATGATVDASGGWFDAGDYVKFVETHTYTVAILGVGVRDFPNQMGSGSTQSDFTAEVKFGMDWLQKMWDDSSRTLYYQVGLGTGNSSIVSDHDIWRLPQADDTFGGTASASRFIRNRPALINTAGGAGAKISPNLAGRLAADFAICYQIFKNSNPAYANQCLLSAEHVFDLANTAPSGNLLTVAPFDFYGETEWRDDMELGASELYLALQPGNLPAGLPHSDPNFYLTAAANWAHAYIVGPGDAGDTLNLYDVSGLAHYELFRALGLAGNPSGLAVTQSTVLSDFQKELNNATSQGATNPFGFGFPWNQDDNASHGGGLSVMASEHKAMTGANTHAAHSVRWLDNILGSNAWGISFIVGAGTVFPDCIQHQIANLLGSLSGGTPVLAGAVVEGSNSSGTSGSLSGMKACNQSARFTPFNGNGAVYVDNVESFNTTEPAIDLTASSALAFAWQMANSGTPTPDFSLGATPASVTVTAGGGANFTATVGAQNGFSGTVTLTVAGLPTGATATFTPGSVSGSGSSALAVSTSGTTPAGNYTLTITGTSGSLTHQATVMLIVNSQPVPDFTLGATPTSRTVTIGSGTTYTVNVTAVNGFAGSVDLTISGLPAGATASFNPTPVSGSGSSTLTVNTSSSTPTGSSTLTITGTSGGTTHTAMVTLVVNPVATQCQTSGTTWQNTAFPAQTGTFTVTFDATPSGSSVGSPINSVIALSNGAQSAYTGFATLVAFNASGIQARNGGTYTAASTIPYTGGLTYHFREVVNVAAHTYSIFVTAPGGTEQTVGSNFAFRVEQNTVTQLNNWGIFASSGSANVCNFTVGTPASDFTVSAAQSTVTVTAGNNASDTVNIGALNGFSGTVTLSASGLPAGATASFSPASVTGAGSSTLTISTTNTTTTGTSTLTISGTSGSTTHTTSVALTVNPPPPPDFSVTATPSSVTVTAGNSATYTATIGSINGFSGTVTLSTSGLPAGATASFSPSSVSGSGSSTLTISTSSTTPAGNSTVTITGMSGSTTHTASVTLIVNAVAQCVTATAGGPWQNSPFANQTASFSVEFDATPSASPVNAVVGLSNGAQTAYTGFAALARFNPSGNIDARNGGAYAAAATIPYSAGVTYHFREVINIPAHTYSVFVTAPGGAEQTVGSNFAFRTEQSTVSALNWVGAFSSSGSETLCNFVLGTTGGASDFTVAATPSSLTVSAGNSGSYTVTASALNGFNGTITLSASGLPAGATASFSPASISASGSSTLTISTSSTTPAGNSTVTITGTSGSTTHTSSATLTVTATGTASRFFAPYLDMSISSNLPQVSTASGIKFFTLAFIIDGGGCTPMWGGLGPVSSENTFATHISNLRAAGGDVVISFGGAAGSELAQVCSTVSSLQAAYQAVINKYNVKMVDFDIEGLAITNQTSVDRRSQALANLAAANTGLKISLTLPVNPTGLDADGLRVVNSAVKFHVPVSVVTVMAMDYGIGDKQMGSDANNAATNTINQLQSAGLNANVGIIPMIGQNDTSGEIFSLTNAQTVLNFAQGNSKITRLSFWSVTRDNGGCAGNTTASDTCSGISQSSWAFSHVFEPFQ